MAVPVRAVVVGYGRSLNTKLFHCEAIRRSEGMILHGVCARTPEYQEEARRSYGGIAVYRTFDEVLNDRDVDLVAITTPSHLHAEMAMHALNAGKHVVVEKPMCLSTHEADALIEASRRCGGLLAVRHNRRWDGDFLTVRKAVAEGALGAVFLLQIAYTDVLKPAGWRQQRTLGGGVLYDLGSHLIDQALQLLATLPATVYATVQTVGWDVQSDTYSRVLLRSERVLADIEVSHVSWIPRPRWYILGDRGGLSYDGSAFRLRTRAGEWPVAREATNEDAFYLNVSQAVQGRARLAVTPEEAREVIRVIEAAFLSAESGQVVTLSGDVTRPNLGAKGEP